MQSTQNIDVVRLVGKKIDLCILRTDEEAIKAYTKWINDESINMYVCKNQQLCQYNIEADWVEQKTLDNEYIFNIVEKTHNRLLVGLCDINFNFKFGRCASLGILIGEEEGRNKGYGTEAISMLIKYCFEELNMHRVGISVIADNERALRCYKKCGFIECGTKHDMCYYKGKWHDVIDLEILEDTYFSDSYIAPKTDIEFDDLELCEDDGYAE